MKYAWNYLTNLGKIMSTRGNIQDKSLVSEVMLPIGDFPVIGKKTILKEALDSMDKFRLGVSCIVDDEHKLIGILTDGDIRRKLLSVQKPLSSLFVDDALLYSIKKPVISHEDTALIDAVSLIGEKKVWDLPVVNKDNVLVGLLHLHFAIKQLLHL